jgi:hypothetical protein
MEANVAFCAKCGNRSDAAPAPVSVQAPRPASAGPPAFSSAMPFLKDVFVKPVTVIKEGFIDPAFAVLLFALVPLSAYLLKYATMWRTITDMVTPWSGMRSVSAMRSEAFEEINFGSAFGNTILHYLIALAILVVIPIAVVKILGHKKPFNFNQMFTLAAVTTFFTTLVTTLAALVMFMSADWGMYLVTAVDSALFNLVPMLLLFFVIKRVFEVATEKAAVAAVIATILFHTYVLFGTERIFTAANPDYFRYFGMFL